MYEVSAWIFVLDVIVETLELMSFLAIKEDVGLLVIMFAEMFKDLINFSLVMPIIVAAFTLSFLGFYPSLEWDEDSTGSVARRMMEHHAGDDENGGDGLDTVFSMPICIDLLGT